MVILDDHVAGEEKSAISCVPNPYFAITMRFLTLYRRRRVRAVKMAALLVGRRPNEYFCELCCYKSKCSTSLQTCNAADGTSLHGEYYVAICERRPQIGGNFTGPNEFFLGITSRFVKTTILRQTAVRGSYLGLIAGITSTLATIGNALHFFYAIISARLSRANVKMNK